jgi:hypothetical protein
LLHALAGQYGVDSFLRKLRGSHQASVFRSFATLLFHIRQPQSIFPSGHISGSYGNDGEIFRNSVSEIFDINDALRDAIRKELGLDISESGVDRISVNQN